MSVKSPETNTPNLADHPMFSQDPKPMEVIAAEEMAKMRGQEAEKVLGIDHRERNLHEADETQARKQWNEFGATAVEQTVESPKKEAQDDPLL